MGFHEGSAAGGGKASLRPKCYLDIGIGHIKAGRLVFEIRKDIAPLAGENFRALCTGELGRDVDGNLMHFRGCCFHRLIKQFVIQGGDFTHGNGAGGVSIYGKHFKDENFTMKHDARGVISMANSGPNTNNSQFFICLSKLSWLDGKHVAFGRLVEGEAVLQQVEVVMTQHNDLPVTPILISDCGQLPDDYAPAGSAADDTLALPWSQV
eukprot:TRINITY_DN9860_c0_g1_i1.p1 TRINITY_DN9860_c0_g1~~TRINITY_DN9860_c0_g1_i1.p1  ORF type:complete len:209 (+),score=62.32 TRINITY_DN9860_c0_g1_i1:82-708(+)